MPATTYHKTMFCLSKCFGDVSKSKSLVPTETQHELLVRVFGWLPSILSVGLLGFVQWFRRQHEPCVYLVQASLFRMKKRPIPTMRLWFIDFSVSLSTCPDFLFCETMAERKSAQVAEHGNTTPRCQSLASPITKRVF